MKLSLASILFALSTFVSIFAQTNPRHVKVNGHYRANGTYVQPHHRTAPNSTNRDNFSTYPNVNPYTGQTGYVKPDNNSYASPPTSTYTQPHNNSIFAPMQTTTPPISLYPSQTHNPQSTFTTPQPYNQTQPIQSNPTNTIKL